MKYPLIENMRKEIDTLLLKLNYEQQKELVGYIRDRLIDIEEYLYDPLYTGMLEK